MSQKLNTISKLGTFISLILLILSLASTTQAQTMRNNDYILKWGNFNSVAGRASDGNTNITFTGGQTAIGLYSGSNFKVRSGFQYIYSIIPFTFTISSTTINFGTLNPGEPITRTNNLIISNGSAFGYQVTAQENHELRVLSTGQTIPDTTCDAGTCTETTSALWNSPLTYGFGYRCDDISGTDCSTDFNTANFYKQFANTEQTETPQVIMSGAEVGRDLEIEVTYKVNISASQAAGGYQNSIMYIATPAI